MDFTIRIVAVRVNSEEVLSPFKVVPGTCSAAVLAEGQACEFSVTFTPSQLGQFAARVEIEWEYEVYDDTGYYVAASLTGTSEQQQVAPPN